MILGIGSDLVDIRRIERTLERFGLRFIRRIFTQGEYEYLERRRHTSYQVWSGGYAKRFSAKESCAKALGVGFRGGVRWRDIEVVNLPGGQPTVILRNKALERLQSITPCGMVVCVSLSLTDEYPFAHAFTVISASFPSGVFPTGV